MPCRFRPTSLRMGLAFLLVASAEAFAPTAIPRTSSVVCRACDPLMMHGTPNACSAAPRAALRMGGAKDGPFTPLVKLTKRIMGKERFLSFRGNVIAEHTKVIQAFVDTADSPFGCMALGKLFELADMDGNGTIDREELKAALYKLGFTHLKDAQIDKILERADGDDNCVIDYDEFVAEAPKTLRVNLVKLAKNNGAELGFLS